MATETERAWCAGFFDGEGSTGAYVSGSSFYNGSRRKYVQASVSNTDKRLLDKFLSIVAVGYISGPYTGKNPKHSPKWVYRVTGLRKTSILYELMKPYLGAAKTGDFVDAFAMATVASEQGLARENNKHGTRAGYRYGCRCVPCKEFNTARIARWRLQKHQ